MTFYALSLSPRLARQVRHPRLTADRSLAMDVREEDEAFVLTALVPGLKADALDIQVIEDVVRLEGEFTPEGSEPSGYLLRELPRGSFQRSLRLPTPIEADQVEARIADGILTLRLPKAESARPKTIKVASK
jgi:HSP20 family protein